MQTRRTRLLGGAFATTRECRETRLCGCLRWRVRLPSAESLKSPRRCCRSRSATQNSGFSKAFQRFLPACCVSASQFAFTRGRLRQRLRGAMTRAPCGYDHAHRPQSLTHMDHGPWRTSSHSSAPGISAGFGYVETEGDFSAAAIMAGSVANLCSGFTRRQAVPAVSSARSSRGRGQSLRRRSPARPRRPTRTRSSTPARPSNQWRRR